MRSWLEKSVAGAVLAAGLGVVGLATPASADVSLDPDVSVQGGAPRLTFKVTNGSPKATLTQVTLTMPDSMPIAEVYPLSIDDWAPRIDMAPLAEPLVGVHGTKVTEAVTDIVWFAMPGKGVAPGDSADILITLGPLPVADQVVFTVTEGYDDGTTVVNDVVPAPGADAPRGAAVLRLIPDPTGGQGDHRTVHGGNAPAAEAQAAPAPEDEGGNSGLWVGIAGMLVGLLGGAVVAWRLARRPAAAASPTPTQPAADTTPKESTEPDSVWRYRDEDARVG